LETSQAESTEMTDWRIIANTQDRLGESIMWHPGEQALYWVDWYGPTLHRLAQGETKPHSWRFEDGVILGSFVFAAGGGILLALGGGLKLFDPATGKTQDFADPNEKRQGVSYNDSKVDRFGRLWVGTFDLGETEPRGILYCVNSTGGYTIGDSGFAVCNGPAFSPDGKTMYFSDSVGKRILAYDVSAENTRLMNRRVFASLADKQGLPDGLTVDAAGDVWCAHYGAGRVTRFNPSGGRKHMFQLPCPSVTSCCIGGSNMSTLYVTTGWSPGVQSAAEEQGPGGSVFAADVDALGLAEPEFELLVK
jgi:sugar lactone lactonase YvrE